MAFFDGFKRSNSLDPNYKLSISVPVINTANKFSHTQNCLELTGLSMLFRTDIDIQPPVSLRAYFKANTGAVPGAFKMMFGTDDRGVVIKGYVLSFEQTVPGTVSVYLDHEGYDFNLDQPTSAAYHSQSIAGLYEFLNTGGELQVDVALLTWAHMIITIKNKSTQAVFDTFEVTTGSYVPRATKTVGFGFESDTELFISGEPLFRSDYHTTFNEPLLVSAHQYEEPKYIGVKNGKINAITQEESMLRLYQKPPVGDFREIAQQMVGPTGGRWIQNEYASNSRVSDPVLPLHVIEAYKPMDKATDKNNYFGDKIVCDDTYVYVASSMEDTNAGAAIGVIRRYLLATGELVQEFTYPFLPEQKFSQCSDLYFGKDMAISGNRLVVTAKRDIQRIVGDITVNSNGEILIFTAGVGVDLERRISGIPVHDGSTFVQGYAHWDYLRDDSLFIDGNTIYVTGVQENDDGPGYKVLAYDLLTGEKHFEIVDPNMVNGISPGEFGICIGADSTRLFIGDAQTGVHVYDKATRIYIGLIGKPAGVVDLDQFGFGLLVHDEKIYIASPSYVGHATVGGKGTIFVFSLNSGSFPLLRTYVSKKTPYHNSVATFGKTMQILDGLLFVSKYRNQSSDAERTNSGPKGAIYVYRVDGGISPILTYGPLRSLGQLEVYFGKNFCIGGGRLVANLPIFQVNLSDTNLGSGKNYGVVDIYDITGIEGAIADVKYNPNMVWSTYRDQFGFSVATDGVDVVIGANGEEDGLGYGSKNSGRIYVFSVDGVFKFSIDNPNAYTVPGNDYFGKSVAISSNYIAASADFEDESGISDSGKVYIFNRQTGALVRTINNPNAYGTGASDQFGQVIRMDDTHLFVGVPYEDDAGGSTSGVVYMIDVETGSLVHTFTNPNAYNTSDSDMFGQAIDISPLYLIVGAYGEDEAGGTVSGKAYIFSRSSKVLLWTLNNPNAYSTAGDDRFGSAVAISDNYVAVTAIYEDDANGSGAGKVYTFNPSTGAFIQTLNNPNAYGTSATDYFGVAVSISGNYLAIGAYGESDASGTGTGKVYIYNLATSTFIRTVDNPNIYGTGSGDNFGMAIAYSGGHLVAGAYNEDYDATQTSSGAAYIFKNAASGGAAISIANPNFGDANEFGAEVACSNLYTVVGAKKESNGSLYASGAAYIFNNSDGTLRHSIINPNAYGTTANDQFGAAVAISDNYVAVTALYEDDVSGSGAGKVYVFNPSTGLLLWTFDNPNAYGTSANDYFGMNLALDGNYLACGVPYEADAGGTYSGKVYIFDLTTGLLVRTFDNPNAYGTSANDYFGTYIGIYGDKCVITAPSEDESAGYDSGKAYVFSISTGSLLFTLNNPNQYGVPGSDYFGQSCAVNSKYIAIGAYGEGPTYIGRVYIFDINTGALIKVIKNPSLFVISGRLGFQMSMTESILVVTAQSDSPDSTTRGHTVYVFDVETWDAITALENPSADIDATFGKDNFGYFSVGCSETTICIGAPYQTALNGPDNQQPYGGAAYFYKTTDVKKMKPLSVVSTPNWQDLRYYGQFGKNVAVTNGKMLVTGTGMDIINTTAMPAYALIYDLTHPEDDPIVILNPNPAVSQGTDNFGYAVAAYNGKFAISAVLESDLTGSFAGAVYLYDTEGVLLKTFPNRNVSGVESWDRYGNKLDLSSDRILIGNNATDKRSVFLLDHDNNLIWSKTNPSVDASVKYAEYLCVNETYSFIAAPKSTYADGSVYVYANSDGALVATITDPTTDGISTSNGFGYGISCSDKYLVVGAPMYSGLESGFGSKLGAFYIFDLPSFSLRHRICHPMLSGYETFMGTDTFNNYDIRIQDDYLIVATDKDKLDGDLVECEVGVVYVFSLLTGELLWSIVNPVTGYDVYIKTAFGKSIAVDDRFLVVADMYMSDVFKEVSIGSRDVVGGIGSYQPGRVYVYPLSPISNAIFGTNFGPFSSIEYGYSLAACNGLLAVGCPKVTMGPATFGMVAIHSAETGEDINNLASSPDPYADVNFGRCVDMDNRYIVAGQEAKAFVFDINDDYSMIQTLENHSPVNSPDLTFGCSIALGGDYVAVGSKDADVNGDYNGSVTVFKIGTPTALIQFRSPSADVKSGKNFGESVRICKDLLFVSAPGENDEGKSEMGRVYIYSLKTLNLIQTIQNPTRFNTVPINFFGTSFDICNGRLVVAANRYIDSDTAESQFFIFNLDTLALEYSSPSWQRDTILGGDFITVKTVGDCIAISRKEKLYKNGNIEGTGLDAVVAGVVDLYHIDTHEKVQSFKSLMIKGETSPLSLFGNAIAFDGNYFFVGDAFSPVAEDTPTTYNGYVAKYNLQRKIITSFDLEKGHPIQKMYQRDLSMFLPSVDGFIVRYRNLNDPFFSLKTKHGEYRNIKNIDLFKPSTQWYYAVEDWDHQSVILLVQQAGEAEVRCLDISQADLSIRSLFIDESTGLDNAVFASGVTYSDKGDKYTPNGYFSAFILVNIGDPVTESKVIHVMFFYLNDRVDTSNGIQSISTQPLSILFKDALKNKDSVNTMGIAYDPTSGKLEGVPLFKLNWVPFNRKIRSAFREIGAVNTDRLVWNEDYSAFMDPLIFYKEGNNLFVVGSFVSDLIVTPSAVKSTHKWERPAVSGYIETPVITATQFYDKIKIDW